MTTTALTWFYNSPGNKAGEIAERVRTNLWDARIGGIWLDVISAEEPYKMTGSNDGVPIEIEWGVGKYFILRVKEEQPQLAERLGFVLAFAYTFTYTDSDGNVTYEWRRKDVDDRWRHLTGNPEYQNLKRAGSQ